MSYRDRKRARKFFGYLTIFGSIGFFLSFLYILFLAGMSDMASSGYGHDFGIKDIVVHLSFAVMSMFVSVLVARFGYYGFDIQDSWIRFLRRKKHR